MTNSKRKTSEKQPRPKKQPKPSSNELPEGLDELLKDQEADAASAEIHRRGQTMANIGTFLQYVETHCNEAIEILERSGCKGVASHFARMRGAGRDAAREVARAKLHDRLVFDKTFSHPQHTAEQPTPEASGLTPADAE